MKKNINKFSPGNELTKDDYYINQEGLIVFTKTYHLKRGYCCESGCRHCPYGYGSVKKKS